MRFKVLTILPEMFSNFKNESIIDKAIDKSLLDIEIHDLREYTEDKHRVVDDYPYGGGAGMVLKPEPLARGIKDLREEGEPVIYLTPQGQHFDQQLAVELSQESGLLLVCGRYRGIDERIREEYIDMEISIGDYILFGGEVPAMVLIEAVSRLIDGVLGNEDSLVYETFTDFLLDSPQYTRPEKFEGMEVPEVLLSGNHEEISRWRKEKAIEKTKERRSDLYEKHLMECIET